MAPIFASPDMALLVAAYPPPLPTMSNPSLVRTYSRDRLVRSDHALKKFHRLLHTHKDRIKLADLPLRLGIQRTDWILACYNKAVFYTADGQSLITEPLQQQILQDLNDRLSRSFMNIDAFAQEHDLSRDSAEEILSSDSALDISFFGKEKPGWITASTHLSEIREQMRNAFTEAASQTMDLSALFHEVPTTVLKLIAREIQRDGRGLEGSLNDSGSRLIFVPSTYTSLQEERRKSERAARVKSYVQALRSEGFCVVGRSTRHEDDQGMDMEPSAAEICKAFESEHREQEPVVLQTSSQHSVVITTNAVVTQSVKAFQQTTTRSIQERHSAPEKGFDQEEVQRLIGLSQQPTLAAAILNDQNHLKTIAGAYDTARELSIAAESANFAEFVQADIAAPLHLYTAGIAEVKDSTLAEHLETYLIDYFAHDHIPQTISTAQDRSFLRNKVRNKDVEKLSQSSKESKSLADVSNAVSRLLRKQKIEAPTPEQIEQVRQSILDQKVKSLQKMTRGSDVLQNIIWILLAKRLSGLFLSSGKDTSRMIKLYERVGDEAVAADLVRWRDALKAAGSVDAAEMQAMKDLALSSA